MKIRVWTLYWTIELRFSFLNWVVLLSVQHLLGFLLVRILLIREEAGKAFRSLFSTGSLRYYLSVIRYTGSASEFQLFCECRWLNDFFPSNWIQVYVDELVEEDYLSICSSLYPSIPKAILLKLVLFNRRLHEDTMLYHKFGQDGSPWEFNLRDVIRSCQIIQGWLLLILIYYIDINMMYSLTLNIFQVLRKNQNLIVF